MIPRSTKLFAGPVATVGSYETVYTAPAATTTLVKSASFLHYASNPIQVYVVLSTSAGTVTAVYLWQQSLAPNTLATTDFWAVLEAGELLQIFISGAGDENFLGIYGAELTA